MSEAPYTVEFSSGAMEDLHAMEERIEVNLAEPMAAKRLLKRIFTVADGLATTPLGNRVLAVNATGIEVRLASMGSFILPYVLCGSTVRVFSALHGSSDSERRLVRLMARGLQHRDA